MRPCIADARTVVFDGSHHYSALGPVFLLAVFCLLCGTTFTYLSYCLFRQFIRFFVLPYASLQPMPFFHFRFPGLRFLQIFRVTFSLTLAFFWLFR